MQPIRRTRRSRVRTDEWPPSGRRRLAAAVLSAVLAALTGLVLVVAAGANPWIFIPGAAAVGALVGYWFGIQVAWFLVEALAWT